MTAFKEKPTIFFDMDGVLADFFSRAFSLLCSEFQCTDLTHADFRASGEYSMENYFGISRAEFWSIVERDIRFWTNLPVLEDTASAFLKLTKDKRFRVMILTAPSENPACLTGKAQWLRTRLGIGVERIVYTKRKYLLANPNALLIDDLDRNTVPFMEAGGRVLELPANWNTDMSTVDVKAMIQESAAALLQCYRARNGKA